jgi:uncharacterized membrane protein YeaQ/YmgE (transglycosylase-associated protein family)
MEIPAARRGRGCPRAGPDGGLLPGRPVEARLNRRARSSEARAIRKAGTQVRPPTIIGFLVAGLVIGALARLTKPGKQDLSILATLLLGLVGSLIGGTMANLLGTGDIFELNVLGFIVAVIAATLLIRVAEGMAGSRRRSVR